MARVGSREHWRDPNSYPQDWESRAVQAARFIQPGSSVLDIGCGPHMALRRHLPADCAYYSADLYQWTAQVRHVDIDANIFPDGSFDCVVLLGVIEYLARPQLAFRFAQGCASAMVISYCYPLTADPRPRDGAGWVNAFSPEEIGNLAAENGWNITRTETFGRAAETHQVIHALAPDQIKSAAR
jgi:methyltransferase family protein